MNEIGTGKDNIPKNFATLPSLKPSWTKSRLGKRCKSAIRFVGLLTHHTIWIPNSSRQRSFHDVKDEQPFVHRSWPPSASRIRAALAVSLSVCLYRNCNAMAHPEFYHRGRPRRPSGVPILVEAECASTGGMAALLWTGRWMPGFAFFSKLVLKQKQADFI